MKKLDDWKHKIFGDWTWNEVLMIVVVTLVIIGFIAFTFIGCCSSSSVEVHV